MPSNTLYEGKADRTNPFVFNSRSKIYEACYNSLHLTLKYYRNSMSPVKRTNVANKNVNTKVKMTF